MLGISLSKQRLRGKFLFLIPTYLFLKKSLNSVLAYLGVQIITKSTLKRTVYPAELHNAFQYLAPKNYNGSMRRVGGEFDGGYLIPDLDYSVVISPGTGKQIEFENLFANIGSKVICIDGSILRPTNLSDKAIFIKKNLSSIINDELHITLKQVVAEHFTGDQGLLLQCDIEGAEWEIFCEQDPNFFSIFSVIVIEMHNLNRLLDRVFLKNEFQNFVSNLKQNFVVINSHPNNAGNDFFLGFKRFPEVLEITMINKKLYNGELKPTNAFAKLNKPNVKRLPERKYSFLK